ncbi:glycosyltransferase [Flavobacterium sp. SM2513]|uniref:glycosyltransferase n=1 Tax=Flavobacterium sp. SM2513 TaxID=3424766 RepID=UPI003D7F6777
MMRKKLVIVSHTNHHMDVSGVVKGWGATINEINYLADYWEEVVHVACLHEGTMPASSLPYIKPNIKFVAIPPYGGKTLASKLGILLRIPKIIQQVVRHQQGATEVQLRLPTSMGLFLLPLFSFFLPRKYTLWIKYAGNWNQQAPPLSYRLQRWWLQKNLAKSAVTLNGFWPHQAAHCYSFENPCLTIADVGKGGLIAAGKDFSGPFDLVFIGRLEDAKGVSRIIAALQSIPTEKINQMHFIGDGPKTEHYKKEAAFLGSKALFHGFLDKEQVHALLEKAHFFLLPSDSEGFPKVIAEAACYGVIPIVSNVGSIPHYINPSNGFVWDLTGDRPYNEVLMETLTISNRILKEKSAHVLEVAKLFTFENYYFKLSLLIDS